jgi:long-chain acyl-CoA synthetase
MASFPWLKHYPKGVPHEINPDAYPSLLEMIDEGLKNFANNKAYACMGKEITFGQLDKLSRDFAAYLQNLGLQKGDRFAIQSPNVLQYPVAMFGALRAGLTIVNTNPLYTPREMEHQFKDSGAKAILIVANFASNLEKVIQNCDIKHIFITQLGDMLGFPKKQIVNFVVKSVKKMVPEYHLSNTTSFMDAVSKGAGMKWTKPNVKHDDLAFIQYTGGTTGVSKGAMLTHRNIISNVEANAAWTAPMATGNSDEVVVAALPLYHVYALTVNALSALKTGAMNLLITNPRDLDAFIKDLKKYQVTTFTGLNTLYNGLLNHAKIGEVDFSKLKITSAGGMAMQRVVAERWQKMTGNIVSEGYGLSETSPVLTSNPIDGTARIGSIGIPFPSTEIRLLSDDNQWLLNTGEVGEICANGPQVMKGYYNRADETEKVTFIDPFDGSKWFKTGDMGMMDADGFFKIVDRKKDMVLVSGFNVYPNEIEDVVSKCDGVLEVACIGVPDDKSGEAVKIFVVKKDPELTSEKIMAYCRENLTAYKCPKHIEFRTELPKTNVGKILRRALKEGS